jgi:hypothetical protein
MVLCSHCNRLIPIPYYPNSLDEKLTVDEKRATLQKSLNMAASNGDVKRVLRLVGGPAKEFVDVNAPDDEGTVPLIYASCFVRYGQTCGGLGHTNTWK